MATTTAPRTTTADEHEYRYPAWVYQIPGVLLILGEFGGVAYLALF